MKTKTCKKALHNLRPLTENEYKGTEMIIDKMFKKIIDISTIIGKQGDSVCIKCGKVFRKA